MILAPDLVIDYLKFCFIYLFAPSFSNFTASFCFQDMERREIKWRNFCLLFIRSLVYIKKTFGDYLWISLTHALHMPYYFEQIKMETFKVYKVGKFILKV